MDQHERPIGVVLVAKVSIDFLPREWGGVLYCLLGTSHAVDRIFILYADGVVSQLQE